MSQCVATTAKGERCRATAVGAGELCSVHRRRRLELDEELLVGRIADAEDWRAAAWLLERQYPDRWARRRAGEELKPEPPDSGRDELDELAGRRQVRRSAT